MSEIELPQRDGGTAIVPSDAIENPGFPPEHERVTDLDPKRDRGAQRGIIALFWISIVGSVGSIAAYIAIPIENGDPNLLRLSTMLIGLGIALALLAIGLGIVHWAKSLMKGHELVEERHETRSAEPTRERALEIFKEANEESGFTRRKALVGGLAAAGAVSAVPAIVLLRDLAPQGPVLDKLSHTMWAKGVRLVKDPTGDPVKADDVTLGSAFHIVPDGIFQREDVLEQKAKAAVLLMRLKPEDLNVSPAREGWNYNGIIAYSKICTHVGCPVALYEQQTHHLLCPCHQSQFDITHEARVIFGPAKRPLPQLPITVDSEGYLVAQSDFLEPVGPSYWERSL